MEPKKAIAAGAGLSGALLLWLVSQVAANEAKHAAAHLEMAVAIARIEARLDFHHGEPTPPEKAVEAAAEASAKVQ